MFDPYEILRHDPLIELRFERLCKQLRGYYSRQGEKAVIVLNKTLTQAERRCTLAEELAHHVLGHAGNYFTAQRTDWITLSKQEQDACVWAADRLIDTHDLLTFAEQDHQLMAEEIAEHFWVTIDVLLFKLQRLVNIQNAGIFILPDIT
ncbi:MAG: ImmA/IrrE family metallo-endopeptidase [Candidatus Aquicultor sp.]|nr:ImmA/IrrE family metallo-endopeptidase [Candidatus Aquicultor sp.]